MTPTEAELQSRGFPVRMTVGEAARAMRCSDRTVHRYCERGRLSRTKRAGVGLTQIQRADVARIIDGG